MVHHYEHEVDTEHAPRTQNCPERLPFLSRVQTLRIHGALHTDSERWNGLTAQCAALQNVRARKLVLVGAPSSTPLTSLPYSVLAAVDEYVLVLSEGVEARAIANDLTNTTVKRATLIFAAEPWMPLRVNEHNWAAFFAELGRQLVHFPILVRIVNAGAIKVGREWDVSRSETYFESHLRDAVRAEQAEYRPWRRPRCEIEFVSMATYLLDAPDDELSPERLAKWRIGLLSKGSVKRPPMSLSRSPKTRRPAPLKPASRIMSLRTQSGPGSPIASMAH
ncbi:hypothetical protein CspHIS471_0301280 [Cutaneotrichosporon sp. HIS471]|nr:hypothetical protein CspHIS471_0301280 [Cutaneotrichosporon sp. HIS471]